MDLLRISEIEPGRNFPFSRSWAYKALHLKRFPKLFIKIGGGAFVDLAEFWRLVEIGRIA
jgi:hypothetical protein